MLNTIRNVSVLGIAPFSGLWSQNPLSVPQIPRLASGTVIPPNREFLAVLGDQTRGTNIEAPLDTIIEAIRSAFQNTPQGQGNITVVLELDRREFGRAVVNAGDAENRRLGTKLILA